MEVLGIGPLELAFILILALIILGPKDMQKAGKTIGRGLRKLVTSDSWKTLTRTSHEIRNLPNKLMREAGLDEELNKAVDLTKASVKGDDPFEAWTSSPGPVIGTPDEAAGHTIAPPEKDASE